MEQLKATLRVQHEEMERKISELEKRLGIAPEQIRESIHPSKPQPLISRNEYEVIKTVLKRLGVDGFIASADYFSEFDGVSFAKYFEYQPEAITAMNEAAMGDAATRSTKEAVSGFIASLQQMNKIAVAIMEDNYFFANIVVLLSEWEAAKHKYQ